MPLSFIAAEKKHLSVISGFLLSPLRGRPRWEGGRELLSAAGNLIAALMHQREGGEGAAASGRNAALQFSFSPAMDRGAPGLFKCPVPLDDVKAAAVAQEERDRMAGGRAGVLTSVVT